MVVELVGIPMPSTPLCLLEVLELEGPTLEPLIDASCIPQNDVASDELPAT